jgi:hypothetical protein
MYNTIDSPARHLRLDRPDMHDGRTEPDLTTNYTFDDTARRKLVALSGLNRVTVALVVVGTLSLIVVLAALGTLVHSRMARNMDVITARAPTVMDNMTLSMRQLASVASEICEVLLTKLEPHHVPVCGRLQAGTWDNGPV